MAVRTISTRLAIEGEAQYKQAVAMVNGELKNLQSALKLVESEYKNNANSMQALTAKGDALSRVYASQQQKVDTLKSALENAQKAQQTYATRIEETKGKIAAVEKEMAALANQTGDTTAKQAELKAELEKLNRELTDNEAKAAAAQKGVNNWERQLNNAKVELNNLSGEIDKNAAYMDEAKAATDGCATSIDRFGKTTKEGKQNAEEFGKTSKEAVDTLAAALAAAGLTRALKEIVDAIAACTDASIEFESAITGVFKTVTGTEQQLATITEGIKQMALDIPATTTELASIAEMAGQLGIQTDNVLAFTRVMADLGETTNISSAEGAKQLAQFANIVQMSQSDFDKLGSTIVALGNNFATTEADILAMAQRLAGAGKQIGLSEAEIIGFAAALSSVGVEAEAGGTAFSKVFSDMQVAVETGKDSLKDFASVAGMTIDEFKTAFRQDAAGAITAFIEGLSKMSEQGISSIATLEQMGITQLRLQDTLLRTSNAGDLVRRAMEMGNTAWKENTALAAEAALRYGTTESKLQLLTNAADGTKRAIGDALAPALRNIADAGKKGFEWATKFIEDNPWLVKALTAVAVALGVLAAAVVGYTAVTKIALPVIEALNVALASNPIGAVALAVGTLVAALSVFIAMAEESEYSVRNLTEATRALPEALADSDKAYQDTTVSTLAAAEMADAYITKLEKLEAAGLGTRESQLAYKTVLASLVELVPSLADKIDLTTGTIEGGTQALRENTAAWKENALQQAMQDMLTEKYKALVAVEVEVAENRIKLEGVTSKLGKTEQKHTDIIDEMNRLMNEATEQAAKMTEELGYAVSPLSLLTEEYYNLEASLVGATDEVYNAQQEVSNLNEAIKEGEDAVNAQRDVLDLATEAMSNYADGTGEADAAAQSAAASISASMAELEAAYQQAYDAAYASIDSQIGLWDEMDNKAKTSAETLNEALESQIEYLDNYTQNLTDLAGRNIEGVGALVETLSDGSAESAAALAGLADASDEEIARLIENLGRVEEGKEEFSTIIAEMQTDFSTKAAELELRMAEMVEEFNKSEEARANGAATMDGLIAGLNSRIATLRAKVNEINSLLAQIGAGEAKLTGKPPGFAHGLAYVPYDDFPALLHKGERVLTAAEAQAYIDRSIPNFDKRVGGSTVNNSKSVQIDARSTINSPVALSEAEIAKETAKAIRRSLWGVV